MIRIPSDDRDRLVGGPLEHGGVTLRNAFKINGAVGVLDRDLRLENHDLMEVTSSSRAVCDRRSR
ncbi:MAG: hypothetical protein IH892_08795 [Planctomycetes bacterium]|nr:hypothetical protein [Planctomycetota bacterium]